MQVQTINFATATKEDLLAAGFALDVLKCKKATRGAAFYTKADCKTRRVRK
jgi:hypothetical protein